jgi:hypothetical protein
MLTIGYEQPDGSVKYLYTSDEMLENVITTVVYSDKPLPTKPYNREELKETQTVKDYLSSELSDEEDTRFRLLRRLDKTWLIRDSYGSIEHDIVITKTNAANGGKKKVKKTRRNRR